MTLHEDLLAWFLKYPRDSCVQETKTRPRPKSVEAEMRPETTKTGLKYVRVSVPLYIILQSHDSSENHQSQIISKSHICLKSE